MIGTSGGIFLILKKVFRKDSNFEDLTVCLPFQTNKFAQLYQSH